MEKRKKRERLAIVVFVIVLVLGISLAVFLQQRSAPGVKLLQEIPRIKQVSETLQAKVVKPSRNEYLIVRVAKEERYLLLQSLTDTELLKALLEKGPRIVQWEFPFKKGEAPPGTVAADERFVDESAFEVGQKVLLYSVPHEQLRETVYVTQIYIFP